MLRRSLKHLGTAVLFGAPTIYLYHKYSSRPERRESFELPVRVRGEDGKPVTMNQRIPIITKEEAEARMHEYASAVSTIRQGIIWKQATAFLASNHPIEDANANKIIERDASDISSPGDLMFFAVMDGHAGPYTSRLLSKTLIPAVAMELAMLINEPGDVVPKDSVLQNLKSLIWPMKASAVSFDADPKHTSLAIERAFTRLDSEIVDAPLRLLAEEMSRDGAKEKTIPDLSQHPMATASMLPAMSGSCALLTLFDTAHRNLYVALTGDCRAVAGVWEEGEDGKNIWRVDVLTEDQTGRNPSELKRMQSEHPPDEADTVIMRGRVLGGLEPTRAFGDARYKWSREVQATLNKAFLEGSGESMRATPSLLKTPPYVTARPVVTHRKLHLSGNEPGTKPKSSLRFVVLATDGLWDELSSEEVVALVGGYLAGLRGTIPKSELSKLVPTAAGTTVEGKGQRDSTTTGSWTFVDSNISTHLIRNAIGGGDELWLRKRLSIPPPLSRRNRDDITCTVVWWEEQGQGETRSTASTVSASVPEVKAKL